jgi:hypothetical protein
MAKIPTSSGGLGALGEPPPAGTYPGIILEVVDEYGVPWPVYDEKGAKTEKTTPKDVSRFIFGVKTKVGTLHKVATRPMVISGSPKSNMFKFIKSLTGANPVSGMDTADLKGRAAQVTVIDEVANSGKTYQNLGAVAPIMDGMEALVPKPEDFANIGSTTAKADESEMAFMSGQKTGGDPF